MQSQTIIKRTGSKGSLTIMYSGPNAVVCPLHKIGLSFAYVRSGGSDSIIATRTNDDPVGYPIQTALTDVVEFSNDGGSTWTSQESAHDCEAFHVVRVVGSFQRSIVSGNVNILVGIDVAGVVKCSDITCNKIVFTFADGSVEEVAGTTGFVGGLIDSFWMTKGYSVTAEMIFTTSDGFVFTKKIQWSDIQSGNPVINQTANLLRLRGGVQFRRTVTYVVCPAKSIKYQINIPRLIPGSAVQSIEI